MAEDNDILKDDVDDTSNQTPAPAVGDVPVVVPPDTGKSMTLLIVAWVAGAILTFLTSKGYLSTDESAQYAPMLQGAIFIVVGWVTTRFLKTRGEIKMEAIRAAGNVAQARASAGLHLGKLAGMSVGEFVPKTTRARKRR